MARARRRAGASYPQGTGTVGGSAAGADPFGTFPGQPDLGGPAEGGAGAGGGIIITNVNTAIAQAIAEQGPGGVSPGPITVGGGGGGNHHHHHHHHH